MDRVWKRMKETAREIAERHGHLSGKHAEAIVLRLCHEQGVELLPQGPALKFLADELVAMVRDHAAA